jgi:hypothetical protein
MRLSEVVSSAVSFIFQGFIPFLPQANPVIVLPDLAVPLNIHHQILLGGLFNRQHFGAAAFYGGRTAAQQRNDYGA